MPELPEVETTCRALRASHIIGKRIIRAEVRPNEYEKLSELCAIQPLLLGFVIEDISRCGKYILLTAVLSPSVHAYPDRQDTVTQQHRAIEFVIHLRMSGRLYISPANSQRSGYERAVWYFDDNTELRFHDPRRFGTINVYTSSLQFKTGYFASTPAHIISESETSVSLASSVVKAVPRTPKPEVKTARVLRDTFLQKKCGVDPFGATFTPQWCVTHIRNRRRMLKALLLDQTFIAGLGNIYCDEALWWAQLHPLWKSDSLTDEEIVRLYRAIRAVLIKGIRYGGTRLGTGASNFQLPQHNDKNSEKLHVYGRVGHACIRCASRIERIKVAGRGTYYCPQCTPLVHPH